MSEAIPTPKYLTTAEVAERLRETPRTVHHWCATGQLAAMVVNRSATAVKKRYRVTEEAVEAFCRARMNGQRLPTNHRRKRYYPVYVT